MWLRGLRHMVCCWSRYDGRKTRLGPLGRRSVCTEQAAEEGQSVFSKRALMQEEGFTEQQIKSVLDIDTRSDRLALLVSILKDHGVTGPTAGSYVAAHYKLLHSQLNQFHHRLQILEDAGLDPNLLKSSLLRSPTAHIFIASKPDLLQKHLVFFKGLGLCPHVIISSIARLRSLKRPLDRLLPRCEVFISRGVSKEGLCKLFVSKPSIFLSSEVQILRTLDFVLQLGFDVNTRPGLRAIRTLYRCRIEKLVRKMKMLESCGLSHDKVVALVKCQPSLLCMNDEMVKKKLNYLSHTLGASVEEMTRCPIIFTCNLEKKVIPRFAAVKELQDKGIIRKSLPLNSVISMSDEKFSRWYGKKARDSAACAG